MIPARIGSKRVKKKNLKLINDKPLISYIIETVKKTNCFDEIYLNSDSNIFKKIADKYSIKFYERDKKFASDSSTNDDFANDFIKNIKADILIQILPTSPFLTKEEIMSFYKVMIKKKFDTLISVENKQIACIFKSQPVNFNKLIPNPPSQNMIPVQAYATVLMGWKCSKFVKNIKRFKSAYHGGNGKTGYFPLKGLSTIDIDTEEDFQLVKRIMLANTKKNIFKKKILNK